MNHVRLCGMLLALTAMLLGAGPLGAADLVQLNEQNYAEFAPQGKEADANYGDYVLRNDQIVVVVAATVVGRNANMTTKNVGGCVIDLTLRKAQNDQLSAYYPGAGRVTYTKAQSLAMTEDKLAPVEHALDAKAVALDCTAPAKEKMPAVTVRYQLADGQAYVSVDTTLTNPHEKAIEIDLTDAVRADRSFDMAIDAKRKLYWAYDSWWDQAYGIAAQGQAIAADGGSLTAKRPFLRYSADGQAKLKLQPGKSYTLKRTIFPAATQLGVLDLADRIAGKPGKEVAIQVTDPSGPVRGAVVTLSADGSRYGWGRTDSAGRLSCRVPDGKYDMTVAALGRPDKKQTVDVSQQADYAVKLEAPGYVVAEISDERGGPIPCKVAFLAPQEKDSPYFGPDSYEHGVQNLYYSHDGRFRVEISPGRYDVIVSYGPEYDAVRTQIDVSRGEATPLKATLVRAVDTTGWVSSDFHSHSSPSGDNTSSQLGRVLNLLCEHIEFAPCTEHNRISAYTPHLKHLGVEPLMATCSGMELTGSPLPINHQNSFPLVRKPHTQDGGAPLTDVNPVAQIERLALWDNNSEKLVQQNHPNIVQMLGDRNQDGKPDGGFEAMFGFMDVIEVHPPGAIFSTPTELPLGPRDRGNTIFHWLQLLNLGYRVPGVVNTDAHYTFHGSGWLRNYIKSTTDDPAKIETLEMVRAATAGHLVLTNGPFMEVELDADGQGPHAHGIPGDDVVATGGKARLHVRVQCANWLDVNRVQVFVNGVPDTKLNFTRKSAPDQFADEVVKFDQTIPLVLDRDAHVIVAAAGEGLQLGPVMGPSAGKAMPVVVSNPIFVDVDGDGFKPNGDMLGLPLPVEPGHKPSHGHGHHTGHSHAAGHHHAAKAQPTEAQPAPQATDQGAAPRPRRRLFGRRR